MRKHRGLLDTSVETPRPHDFAVRFHLRSSRAMKRPSHPAPNVDDDAQRPSYRAQDARKNAADLPDASSDVPATHWHDGQITSRAEKAVKCQAIACVSRGLARLHENSCHRRHREEPQRRSDPESFSAALTGLLRFARNDG
jgi:hypothetical protein